MQADPRAKDSTVLTSNPQMRAILRSIRKHSAPLRNAVRMRLPWRRVQRSVRLGPDDPAPRRRRRHVLVDLIYEHCRRSDLVVVEVGSHEGHTTAHLQRYCPQVRCFHAVDIKEPDPEKNAIRGLDRVHFIQGLSDQSAARFEDESVDLVFIDADHSEQAVAKDIEAWLPKLKPGGVMSGHDYGSKNYPGVKRAVDRHFAGGAHPVREEANRVWWTLK